MRRELVMVMAVTLLQGCAGMIAAEVNGFFAESVGQVRSQPPELEIVVPEQLATVQHLAVMPFEIMAFRTDEPMDAYRGDEVMRGRMIFPQDYLGRMLADRFEEQFLSQRVVDVVERARLSAVLREQSLAQSLGAQNAPEALAGTAGADAVLFGSITWAVTYLPDNPQLNSFTMGAVHVRLVDTRNGRILAFGSDKWADTGPQPDDEAMARSLASRLTQRISKSIEVARERFPEAKAPEPGLQVVVPRAAPVPAVSPFAPAAPPAPPSGE